MKMIVKSGFHWELILDVRYVFQKISRFDSDLLVIQLAWELAEDFVHPPKVSIRWRDESILQKYHKRKA
jgi:hypothetical protein